MEVRATSSGCAWVVDPGRSRPFLVRIAGESDWMGSGAFPAVVSLAAPKPIGPGHQGTRESEIWVHEGGRGAAVPVGFRAQLKAWERKRWSLYPAASWCPSLTGSCFHLRAWHQARTSVKADVRRGGPAARHPGTRAGCLHYVRVARMYLRCEALAARAPRAKGCLHRTEAEAGEFPLQRPAEKPRGSRDPENTPYGLLPVGQAPA